MASPQKDTREDEADDDAEGEGEGEGEEVADDDEVDEDERDTPRTPIEGEEGMTPTADNESEGGAQDTPSRPSSTAGRGGSSMLGRPPRRRRIGRPPKNKPADWDAEEGTGTPTGTGRTGTPDTPGARSGANTPVKRGRGRGRPYGGGAGGSGGGAGGGGGGGGAGRWGPKSRGSSAHVSHLPLDKDGNVLEVVDDEVALPEDPEGETKVDKLGNLLGGREFRVRTFKVLDRGDRQYMLSTEPARCIGFRDSYLFFQKHRLLYKIIIDDEAKRDLIERDIIPHSYKGRAIGIVTARSVFREFGARIIIGGRKVVDDYHAQEARDRGDVEGELAVPEDRLPAPGEKYNKNQYVAWHGASSVYHSGVPSVPMPVSKAVESKKRKIVVTGDNWMVQHAREARYVFCPAFPLDCVLSVNVTNSSSRFNSELASLRRENINGVYDIHTNLMMYPKTMQPTHARWEQIEPSEDASSSSTSSSTSTTIFPSVRGIFSRNFRIHDIAYESAPNTSLNLVPGPDGDYHDLGSNGLISLDKEASSSGGGDNDRDAGSEGINFKMTPEVLAELPEDCRQAYLDAAAREWQWKNKWKGERVDGARANLAMNFSWTP